jgi:hypothetical protein
MKFALMISHILSLLLHQNSERLRHYKMLDLPFLLRRRIV